MRHRTEAERAAAAEDAIELVKAIRKADRWSRFGRLVSYLILVIAMLVGFYKIQDVQDNDCIDRQANRQALRDQYVAVAELGEKLVAHNTEPGKSRAVAKFKQFRDENLKKLPPIECD